jgi:hypothetical protein
MNGEKEESTGSVSAFGQTGDNDHRLPGDWASRYADCKGALRRIRLEAAILLTYFFGQFLLLASAWSGTLFAPFELSDAELASAKQVVFMACGGLLGGTVYAMKWLYHSCAKNRWNEDRFIWRYTAPLVSLAVAVALLLLCRSGVVSVFDPHFATSLSACYSLGFLVGYFSDNAVGKLSEIALTLFGARKPAVPSKAKKDEA